MKSSWHGQAAVCVGSESAVGYLSRVERAVTCVGLAIIEKLAAILEVDPAKFFRRPARPASVDSTEQTTQ